MTIYLSGTFAKARYFSGRMNHPVAVLLKSNVNLAYTVDEICKLTKMKDDSVRSILRVLKEEEKVIVHKSPYFAWSRVVARKTVARKPVARKPVAKKRAKKR